MDKRMRNQTALLNCLQRAAGPLTSRRLAELVNAKGLALSERTVRLYLNEMDEAGLTQSHGRRGRTITDRGVAELQASQAAQRVGYLSAKIDQMTYAMNFDLATRTGNVVVNTSLVNARQLADCVDQVCAVFERGLAMGKLLSLIPPGESVGGLAVPADKLGFCTVCSITLNGVLLKHGIPTHSRFGGLLELRNGSPTGFLEMIHYNGTSIDPLEVFIRSGMTNYRGAVTDGNGRVGASFREMPEDAREQILHLSDRLTNIGLGAFLKIGLPGESVFELSVSPGLIGSVVVGGLNPIAILEELGYRVYSRALAGLLDYSRLFSYEELPNQLRRFV